MERVARLVTTAGATLKEKKRPIKVVARDGTVKKVVPHVEVIEGLLHHEGISGELQAGVRPKTVLCEVCRCVVEVKPGNVPRTCKEHQGRKPCPRGCGRAVVVRAKSCAPCQTPEERAVGGKSAMGKLTDEEKMNRMRKAWGGQSVEGMVTRGRALARNRSTEDRREASRKFQAAREPRERSESSRKANAAMSPEERQAAARKRWETRRAKKAASEKAGEE